MGMLTFPQRHYTRQPAEALLDAFTHTLPDIDVFLLGL